MWARLTSLFAINCFLILRLFGVEYTQHMGSIEAAYIGLTRYIRGHFPDLGWFPLWYGGIPYPDTYPPLLHFLTAAAVPLSPGLAYHFVTALLYALAPVALCWTLWKLGADRNAAFVASLLYSLISPTCWLVSEVRHDSGGWFGARRLQTLLPYGEGPHLTSVLFLILAIGLLHVALEKRRPLYYVLAAFAVAATVLSNWIGAFALALIIGSYLLAYRRGWVRTAAIGCYAYALAMPWATPSTIATIRANAPLVGGRFVWNAPLTVGFVAGVVLLVWMGARFGALFLYMTAYITLAAYWFGWALLPQPHRYHIEMDLAFWMALGLMCPPISRRVMWIAAALCLPILLYQHKRAHDLARPIDVRPTAEYRISTWLGQHMPGERVFAPGTDGFWMNAFSDTPLLTGGFDNGERNTFLQDVLYQIYAGDKREVAIDWLNAFGCDAVVGDDPTSGEFYHPYAHPDRFRDLPELWRDGAEVIYSVPGATHSLAHAVHAADLPAVRPPAYDTTLLKPYLGSIAGSALDMHWNSAGSATIRGDLSPEHLVSVQITFDEGWKASVNGQTRRLWGDRLGQVVVEPQCTGSCTIELNYVGDIWARMARWLSPLALLAGIAAVLRWTIWPKRSDSTTTN
jgi:hypothetical protein